MKSKFKNLCVCVVDTCGKVTESKRNLRNELTVLLDTVDMDRLSMSGDSYSGAASTHGNAGDDPVH